MTDTVIRVEGLGKSYRLRHRKEGYVALRDVIAERALSFGRRLLGRKVAPQEEAEEFWALRDVSFELRRGEVLGVIGRNGAGKSTLLKILSRITEPTEGRVCIRGRVASLLEIGTGFHPELSGRENIFLNGSILGMGRREIARNFNEIVAFAEVEKFLDTPVKHYSSGMYVRLAFAVAAHLDPDILVVDEVLAVGDGEFQKRCLGKLREVSRGGRTVLFVTHNMAAVKNLTTRSLVLNAGRKIFDGATDGAVSLYASWSINKSARTEAPTWGDGIHTSIVGVHLVDSEGCPTSIYNPGHPFRIEVELKTDGARGLSLDAILFDDERARIGLASTYHFHGQTIPEMPGRYRCVMPLRPLLLAAGSYSFDLATSIPNIGWDHYVTAALDFEVPFSNPYGSAYDFRQSGGYGHLALTDAEQAQFDAIA